MNRTDGLSEPEMPDYDFGITPSESTFRRPRKILPRSDENYDVRAIEADHAAALAAAAHQSMYKSPPEPGLGLFDLDDTGAPYYAKPEPDPIVIPTVEQTGLYSGVGEILQRQANTYHTLEKLDADGFPEAEQLMQKMTLRDAAEIIEKTQDFARELAIGYVKDGAMSRVQAAELLHVHQGTIAKWVKDSTDD